MQITSTGADCDARWSPDGTRIVFTSRRGGNSEIYAAKPDGTEEVNFTMNLNDDFLPSWAPCE